MEAPMSGWSTCNELEEQMKLKLWRNHPFMKAAADCHPNHGFVMRGPVAVLSLWREHGICIGWGQKERIELSPEACGKERE